ncbi:MAG: DNA polymerase [Coriobacteriia bacterium]
MSKTRFAVIDAETDPFDGENLDIQPFVWGFYDGENYLEFDGTYCTENLVEYISQWKGVIFAHNGGKFDFHFLAEYFSKESPITVINGRIAKAKLGECTLHDSYCLLPIPLAALEKDHFDYSILEKDIRDLAENKKKISEYLKHDCEYLFKYVMEFINQYGYNITLASTAMKQWKTVFNGSVPSTTEAYYDQFYPFYYGGRVQPFKAGIFEGDFTVYDINSAYPRAMMDKHIIGKKFYLSGTPKDSKLGQSMLTVEGESLGGLPMRTKQGLSFPVGKGVFHCTGWEFMAAIKTKTLKNHKILKCYVFEDVCSFSEYVEHFYAMKLEAEKEGDKAKRTFAKLLMNSLYGKFATDPREYSEYYLDDFGARPKEDYAPGAVYGDCQLFGRDLPENKWRFLNIATSASITGWVRAYLWESILSCENVLYCDTDSIICANGDKLPQGDKLGEWGIDGKASRVAIAGKKLYACFGDFGKGKTEKVACKGVRLSAQEIERVAAGELIEYNSIAPSFSIKNPPRFVKRKVQKTA